MESILFILRQADGVMKTADINDAVAKNLNISDELLSIEDANCTGTEYSYRMRWARTELKQKGKIKNVKRGEWRLS
jgi:restriction endonuclease Mrr